MKKEHHPHSNWLKLLRFVFSLLKTHKMYIGIILLASLGYSILSGIAPTYWGSVFDRIADGEYDGVLFLLVVYSLLTIFTLLLNCLAEYFEKKLAFVVEARLRHAIFSKILHSPCKEIDQYDTGTLVSRIMIDVHHVISFTLEFITSLSSITVGIGMSIACMWQISNNLSIVAVVSIPISVFAYWLSRNSISLVNQKKKKHGDLIYSFIVDSLRSILGIKAFCIESQYTRKYAELNEQSWKLQKSELLLRNKVDLILMFINIVSKFITIGYSANLISAGQLTIGGLIAFQQHTTRLHNGIVVLPQLGYSSQSAIVSMERLEDLLIIENEFCANTSDIAFAKITSVNYQDIVFGYNNSNTVLHGFSLSISSPGLYAIVGENGCGKSTVLKLLMQFYSPNSGTICINNMPISTLAINQLRAEIGYYSNDVFIANDSVYYNLTMREHSSPDQCEISHLLSICRKIGLDDIVMYPTDLDKRISNHGYNLSCGQRQKIAIARALLDKASVLLLDEITSNLDGETLEKALSALSELAHNKIIIMVTHQYQVVDRASKVVMLDQGVVLDLGTHKILTDKSAKYRKLFDNSG